MGINLFNLKKWGKMLIGRSILHVNQNIGRIYSKENIEGYYNDLTEKVTRQPQLLLSDELPKIEISKNNFIDFSVGIFQYGLGAYDLYLLTKQELYLNKFWQAVDWTIKNQERNGAWNTFGHIYPKSPYGAMAQGEAASLLIRAYTETNKSMYLEAAKAAIDYMILPIENGGCTEFKDNNVIFYEVPGHSAVLNGWIFAWWGLFDFVKITNDTNKYKKLLDQSLNSLIDYLPKFKHKIWSKYNLSNSITSPFYHNLHIAQLKAMYDLTNKLTFKEYMNLWERQQSNKLFYIIAFIIKVYQKNFKIKHYVSSFRLFWV